MLIDYSFIIQITFIIIHVGSALIDKGFICAFVVVVVPTTVIIYYNLWKRFARWNSQVRKINLNSFYRELTRLMKYFAYIPIIIRLLISIKYSLVSKIK